MPCSSIRIAAGDANIALLIFSLMKKFTVSTALLLLFLIGISCQRKGDTNQNFEPLQFAVDSTLLGAPERLDDAFILRFPANWEAVDEAALKSIQEVITQDTAAFFDLEMLAVHHSSDGALCTVGRIRSDRPVFDRLNAEYDRTLKAHLQADELVRGAFRLNGCKVIQYRGLKKDMVLYKLFLQIGGGYYQLDYIVPRSLHEGEIKKVESSLGSLQLLPAKNN